MRVEGDGTVLARSESANPSFVASELGKLVAMLDPLGYIATLGVPVTIGSLSNQTADGTLVPAPPTGQKFYLVGIIFSAHNTSTSAVGVVEIRDGVAGAALIPYLMGQAGVAGVAASQPISAAPMTFFPACIPFSNAVVVDITSGTVRYSAVAVGFYK